MALARIAVGDLTATRRWLEGHGVRLDEIDGRLVVGPDAP
jgi:hypothetical protein